MSYLYREDEIFVQQKKILKKISELSSSRNDSDEILTDKNEQISIFSNSFGTYTKELNGLFSLVSNELPIFNQKLRKVAEACGDYEAENVINNLIMQKLKELGEKETEINTDRNNLLRQVNELASENSVEDKLIENDIKS